MQAKTFSVVEDGYLLAAYWKPGDGWNYCRGKFVEPPKSARDAAEQVAEWVLESVPNAG